MRENIAEADWRHFKRVHQILSERFCQGVLDEIAALLRANQGSAHERYRQVYQLMEKRDADLARAFDDFRRSTAIIQLTIMRGMKLLGDEELAGFSQETQDTIRSFDSLTDA